MNANRGHIYQSGEHVSISGMYEVVGLTKYVNANRVQLLHTGEIFPCFDGVEVCWYLRSRVIEPIPEVIASDVSETMFYG